MGKLLRFNEAHYIHFVTSRTYQGIPYFNNVSNCLILLGIIQEARRELGFKLSGYVIMPDHFHCLIEPDIKGVHSISYIMMRIKGYSARLINLAEAKPSAKRTVDNNCFNNKRLGEGSASPYQKVWQKSFYDIQIYSEKFFEQKLNYIHNNPLRAGLVEDLKDYLWSSYQNYYINNHRLIKIDISDNLHYISVYESIFLFAKRQR